MIVAGFISNENGYEIVTQTVSEKEVFDALDNMGHIQYLYKTKSKIR